MAEGLFFTLRSTRMKKEDRRFSVREARAVLWLLPVLAVAGWLVREVVRADSWAKARDEGAAFDPSVKTDGNILSTETRNDPGLADWIDSSTSSPRNDGAATFSGEEEGSNAPQLFTFDPNTIEYHDLVRLGFERNEALGIIKYRERGKVFEIPEDFAACFQVSEAMYRRLEPWIRIGEEFRLKRWAEARREEARARSSLRGDEVDEGILNPESGLLRAESDVGVPIPRNDDVGGVSFSGSERPLVDLNTADSAALIAVSGIGPGTVGRIMEYRARLGGFVDVSQLAEVRGVTEQNYERMIEQIYVDPAVIQKIDINFAPAKSLASHPYMRAEALRKLLKERQLKGGWRTVEELAQDDIFTAEELAKLGPYLIFN